MSTTIVRLPRCERVKGLAPSTDMPDVRGSSIEAVPGFLLAARRTQSVYDGRAQPPKQPASQKQHQRNPPKLQEDGRERCREPPRRPTRHVHRDRRALESGDCSLSRQRLADHQMCLPMTRFVAVQRPGGWNCSRSRLSKAHTAGAGIGNHQNLQGSQTRGASQVRQGQTWPKPATQSHGSSPPPRRPVVMKDPRPPGCRTRLQQGGWCHTRRRS